PPRWRTPLARIASGHSPNKLKTLKRSLFGNRYGLPGLVRSDRRFVGALRLRKSPINDFPTPGAASGPILRSFDPDVSAFPHRVAGSTYASSCRVEERRGSLGHAASLRFLSPLIEPDMGAPIRLSDKTSGVRSRKATSFRLQFDEPQGLVEVLVRKACSP